MQRHVPWHVMVVSLSKQTQTRHLLAVPAGGGQEAHASLLPTLLKSKARVSSRWTLSRLETMFALERMNSLESTVSSILTTMIEAEFLQIHAEGLKTPLEVSPDHMIFVKSALFPIRASQVKVGDLLSGENKKVAQVKSVKRRGVYTPVTESGDIVVSGVLASSYAAVHNYTPINQHWEAHAFFAIRRMVCSFKFGICENETYTDDGIPDWLSSMAHFAKNTEHNAPAQVFASVVGLPLIAVAYFVEQIFIHHAFLVAGGGVFIVGLFALKKKKTKASKVKVH